MMRSILVYADRGPTLDCRIESALALARTMDGAITVLIDTPIARYIAMDPMGGTYVASDAMQRALEDDDRHAEAIAARLAQEGVPFTVLRSEDEPVDALAAAARLADIVIVTRGDGFGGELALAARTPVLILPDHVPLPSPVSRACVAWDGGNEAALVLRRATAMLSRCAHVRLLTVQEKAGGFSTADALRYLELHGVSAEAVDLTRQGSTEQTLAAAVKAADAQLLVMGAYGRSRMREYLFGGVTRHFLEDASAPALLLSH